MANAHNYYLSYLRTGLSARVGKLANSTNEQRVKIELEVETTAQNSKSVSRNYKKSVALYGPGDVLGFHPKAIRNVAPIDNAGNFRPELTPYVEFSEVDFLWRYSSQKSSTNGHWLPWVSLIILKANDGEGNGEFEFVKSKEQSLPPQIKLAANAVLPNLEESWRWGHIHVLDANRITKKNDQSQLTKAQKDIQEILKRDPRRGFCRLIAPRRLTPGTKYCAFIVPTFKLGLEAAKGTNLETLKNVTRTTKSWETGKLPEDNIIPFYYKWDFRTGVRGDFEYFVRQLQYKDLKGLGKRKVDVTDAGYNLKGATAEELQKFKTEKGRIYVEMEGALQSTDVAYQKIGVDSKILPAGQLRKKLADQVLNLAEITVNGKIERRVVPPIYGRWYVSKEGADVNLNSENWNSWLEELNLDFRHRIVAGMGVKYVKDNQEKLMKAAWQQQALEVKKINRKLNKVRFGRAITKCLHKRIENLSDEKMIQMGLGVQSRIVENSTSRRSLGKKITVQQNIGKSNVITPIKNIKMRKYLEPKFKIQRTKKASFNAISVRSGVLQETSNLNHKQVATTLKNKLNPAHTIEKKWCIKIEKFRSWEDSKKPAFSSGPRTPASPPDPLRDVIWYPEFHTPMYRYLRDISQDMILPGLGDVPQNTVSLLYTNPRFIESFLIGLNHEFASELRWREFPTDMKGSYFRKFWDTSIYSVDENEKIQFRSSSIGQQLKNKISNQFPEFNSIQKIENVRKKEVLKTTETDRIVAAEYEEAIEKWLLTRDEDKDIQHPISWPVNSKLGTHALTNSKASGDPAGQIVILIRGDLLQQFPSALMYLAPKGSNGPNFKDKSFPIFEGGFPPDIVFHGFDIPKSQVNNYYLVFEEPLTDISYGLDEKVDSGTTGGGEPWENVNWGSFGNLGEGYLGKKPPTGISQKEWNNPAFIAKMFTQKSVRVAIPLSRFIK